MEQTLRSSEAPESPMVEDGDQPAQLRAFPDDGGHGLGEGTMDHHLGRKPYAVRVRMIILLSLLCWSVLIAAVALILA